MTGPRRHLAVCIASCLLTIGAPTVGGAQAPERRAGADPVPELPATRLPAPERRAVALADGQLQLFAEATAPVRTAFEAGSVFAYFGETTDAFGRTWSIVGDPAAWSRAQRWLVLPERFARTAEPGQTLAFLDTLGAPAVTAATRRVVRVPAGWWREPEPLRVVEPPRPGELLGVPAYRIPAELLPEVLELSGGLDTLGPWPEAPVRGQLHVGRFQPLVWFWDSEWTPGETVRLLSPVLGLLGNPLLVPDAAGPDEMTGMEVPCWTLVGALDAAGAAVGEVGDAPDEPATVPGLDRGEDPLGARDFGLLGWPVADEEVAAPRRVLLQGPSGGVLLQDDSNRQAVYLEQTLPAEVTARLRGRTVRLRVMARAVQQGDTATSVAVGIEMEAGSAREALATQVGVRSTPIIMEMAIPDDAETLTVRLLPQDRSIAVAERGRAVFDAAALAPVEWPATLTPDSLPLRRTLVVGFEPRRAFTRAPIAISSRETDELRDAWPELGNREADRQREILAGELTAGMSPEEVALAWGEAGQEVETGALVRWDWSDRSAAFRDGRLISWTTTPLDPPAPEPGVCRTPREPVA